MRGSGHRGPADLVLGIDGWRDGWVAVALAEGRFACARVDERLAELVRAFPDAAVVAVDVPIGVPERGERPADVEVRRLLGSAASSIFMTPPRAALEADTYAEANARTRALTGKGLSRQAWALKARIVEADVVAAADARLHEVHPELSFVTLAGATLGSSKRSWNGLRRRLGLLEEAGIVLPSSLVGDVGRVPADDLLHAAAAAWTAIRIARGEAIPVPSDVETDAGGRGVAIWR